MNGHAQVAVPLFVQKTLYLLSLEAHEEAKHDTKNGLDLNHPEKQGDVLREMIITSCTATLYGNYAVCFKHIQNTVLKARNIRINDTVIVSGKSVMDHHRADSTGIVTSMTEISITVEFEDNFAVIGLTNFTLLKRHDHLTYTRMQNAMTNLMQWPENCYLLMNIRFGTAIPKQIPIVQYMASLKKGLTFSNPKLNIAQKSAVRFAFQQEYFAIVHGPPGTGKTTAIVEIIVQLVKKGEKILVCTPSNIAVDNLMEKLSDSNLKVLRLGRPARMSEKIKKFSLDAVLASMYSSTIMKDVKQLLDKTIEQIRFGTQFSPYVLTNMYSKAKKLRREMHEREASLTTQALFDADVVCATLSSSSKGGVLRHMPENHFHTLIIDECSQALEAACWIAMPWAKKCILAGDHRQLPPVVKSSEALKQGLGISLMEQLISKHGEVVCKLLTEQFRMNKMIMNWISNQFYAGRLTAHSSVAHHLLKDLPGVEEIELTDTPLILVDTSGCHFQEHKNHGLSFGNYGEAEIVTCIVRQLIEAGVPQEEIAVITPYKRQVEVVEKSLQVSDILGVEVATVDGFQGREKEAVLFSFVRSNADRQIGFVSERSRTNVAVSRARRLVCVVGDTNTLSSDALLCSLVNYIRANGVVKSAHEHMNEVFIPVEEASANIPKGDHTNKRGKKKQTNASSASFEDPASNCDETLSNWLDDLQVAETEKSNNHSIVFDEFKKTNKISSPISSPVQTESSGETDSDTYSSPEEVKDPRTEKLESLDGRIKKSSSGKKKDVKTSQPQISEQSDLNSEFDSVVSQFQRENSRCAWHTCNTSILMLFHDCKLCGKRFCLPHILPEVHGCGEEAKKAAKKEFRHPPPKPPSDQQKKQLASKLSAKLASMSGNRKAATK